MPTVAELTTKEAPTWCAGCVLPGTLIQSNPSAKKIETIQVGEKALGKDGRFHKVTKVMTHMHKGKMYRLVSKCFGETVLTDEHPVLCARRQKVGKHNETFETEWVRADSLRQGDYLVYPILAEVEDKDVVSVDWKKSTMDRKSKNLPDEITVNADLLRLAGYYIAEGHAHSRTIELTFNEKETQYAKDAIDIVSRLFGLKATEKVRKDKHTRGITINYSPLTRLFAEWFGTGAENKKIPHFMMLLPPSKQKELIKGLWRGDGYIGGKKAGYKTISKVLTEQIKMLLLRQSIVPSVSKNKAYGIHKESYNMEVCGKKNVSLLRSLLLEEEVEGDSKRQRFVISKTHVFLPIRKIETFDYDGDVYNFEVEDVQSYVSENATLHNCGDFTILSTIKSAFVELNLPQHQTLVVSGIGCGSKTPHFIKTYGFEGLHGRALPVASAAKLVNPELNVVVVSGDGDCYGIGANHLVHSMRRNMNITLIVQNNEVYGLTKGQYSPTSEKGFKSPSTPNGAIEEPVNPIKLALAMGATYVARGYAFDIVHLKKLIVEGMKHKGFAIIDVFQPCSTYNKINTMVWYKQHLYKLEESGHDPTSLQQAWARAEEWGEKIPTGLFFKAEKPTYEEAMQMALPPVKHDISNVDIEPLLARFR